jgi:hypothetical protein
MIKIRKHIDPKTSGIALVLFWILSLNFMHNTIGGNHLSFGIGVGPLGVSMQLHLYEVMLP